MTHEEQSTNLSQAVQLLAENGFEGMANAIEILFNEAMRLQRQEYIGAAPYERSHERRAYANGFKPKTVNSRVGKLNLQVPQTRDGQFYPNVLEKGERSEKALKLAVAEMYVQGVSTRKVAEITAELCGLEVTSTQVNRAAALLDEELEAWRNRPLEAVEYLVLDARYEKVRLDGAVRDAAVFVAIGVLPSGHRSVLGVSVSLPEAEVHWRAFLESLLNRGMHGIKYIVSDDHAGLRAARQAVLPATPWQRCQFHMAQNAMHYTPSQKMRSEVAEDIRDIFNAKDTQDAETQLDRFFDKYKETAPRLATWAEENLPEGFRFFSYPKNTKND